MADTVFADTVFADTVFADTGLADTGLAGVEARAVSAQRRSWRCLHATHRVARGNACRRAFPIGLPHDSHTP